DETPRIDLSPPAGFNDAEDGRISARDPSSVLVPKLIRLAMTACLSAVSASLLVGGRSGLVTKAVMASQSLRISRASARALAASASSLSRQARLRRAMMGLRARAPSCSATGGSAREVHARASRRGVVIVALDEGDAFADQMREAALAALVAAVDYITVGHQPAQEGLADQIADLFSAPAGDLEHGGRRTQGDPKPAQMATLRPWRLLGQH